MVNLLRYVFTLVALAAPSSATSQHDSPQVRDIFYDVLDLWEDYLGFADDLEAALWNNSRLNEIETWQLWLHNSLASGTKSLEALAQIKLLELGQTEDEIHALYRLDPRIYSVKELALFRFSQRAGTMPVRVNAADIAELREHYDERDIVDIMMLNSYGAQLGMLYATGYVTARALNPEPPVSNTLPDLKALSQVKQETSTGFERRQFLESPILSPVLSMPYLGMDWLMFNDHAFTTGEAWEFFMIGMKASDCKHCQTHAALGMQYYGREHSRIQALYLYDVDPTPFTDKERAAFDFVSAAVQLPTPMTRATIAELRRYYSEFEIAHIIGMAGVIAFLSNYMQISAVVTDQESVDFANQVLAPVGWHLGRHSGWPEEQRVMHPTTLFRLVDEDDAQAMNALFYSHAFRPVLVGYWTERLGPVVFLVIVQLLVAGLLLYLFPKEARNSV